MISLDCGSRMRANIARRGSGNFSGQRFERIARARTGDAHDGDRDRRAAGGERVDGVAIGHVENLGAELKGFYSYRDFSAIKADFAPRVAAQE